MSTEKENRKITEIVKKVVGTSIGAAFLTEDAIKNILSDLPLPKDVVKGLINQAKDGKKDFIDNIKNEFKLYLNKVDPTKEIDKVLDKYDIEIKANLSFKRRKDDDSASE